jgi:hypothetical protein
VVAHTFHHIAAARSNVCISIIFIKAAVATHAAIGNLRGKKINLFLAIKQINK